MSWKKYISGINIVIALVLINVILAFLPVWRIDLTKNKIHSLSKNTTKTISGLDDVVNIKVYLSESLPPEVKPLSDSLKIILNEFSRINSQKIKVTYLDPIKDQEIRTEAENLGIQPLQFSSVKNDKFEMSNGYFGLAVNYKDKREVLPVAGDVSNIEYYLMSTIKRLTEDKVKKVIIASTFSQGETLQYLVRYLEKTYTVENIDIGGSSPIADDAQLLLVIGGDINLPESRREEIKKWIGSGRPVGFFLNKFEVNQNMAVKKVAGNSFEKILSDFQLGIRDGLVADEAAAIASFQTGSGSFLSRYPYWPSLLAEKINREIPVTAGIDSLTLAWASPVEPGDKGKILFSSSDKSIFEENVNSVSPVADLPKEGNQASWPLGVIESEDNIRLLLVGDADFISDQFVTNNQQNLLFALNSVDYLVSDEALLDIRSKVMANSQIRPVGESQKNILKVTNLAVPVVLLAATGVIFYILRKKSNENFKEA